MPEGKTCSVDECERSTLARGFCQRHYQAWYKENRAVVEARWAERERLLALGLKRCGNCEQVLPVDQFPAACNARKKDSWPVDVRVVA